MAKKQETRYIYVKDREKSREGFGSYDEARRHADSLGPPEGDLQRVRVRMRSRTGLWDVVVKVRREEKPPEPQQQK